MYDDLINHLAILTAQFFTLARTQSVSQRHELLIESCSKLYQLKLYQRQHYIIPKNLK